MPNPSPVPLVGPRMSMWNSKTRGEVPRDLQKEAALRKFPWVTFLSGVFILQVSI